MSAILLFVKRMKNNEIYDRQGNKLGNITDVMLDESITRARYVVLSCGASLGTPKKLFAVPPEALELDTENECFVIDADKDLLAEAPGFDVADPPPLADPLFTTALQRQVKASGRSGRRATPT
jgi:PRC-barrel domain protein